MIVVILVSVRCRSLYRPISNYADSAMLSATARHRCRRECGRPVLQTAGTESREGVAKRESPSQQRIPRRNSTVNIGCCEYYIPRVECVQSRRIETTPSRFSPLSYPPSATPLLPLSTDPPVPKSFANATGTLPLGQTRTIALSLSAY